ncbi:MAG: cation:proton antiporter [Candidatus Bathyarchaeia archaeon]
MLKLFSAEALLPAASVFSALALMLILFQGGLNLEAHTVLSQSFKSATLALMHVILAVLFVPLLSYFMMGFSWLEGLILGSMAAGTSSVVIIPLMLKMRVPDEVRATLSLESTITDVLNIILAMIFLDIYFGIGGFINLQEIISALIAKFAVGMFLGVIAGAAWIKILLEVIKGQEYTCMLTIAALAICYAGTEMLSGSGPLSALVFGITLGNFMMMRNLGINVNAKSMQTLMGKIKSFQDELTFLVRALFFVTLGLIYVPDLTGFIYAAVIMAANFLLRNLAVKFSTRNTMLYKYGRFMTLMCGTGLANATLSIIIYSEMVARQIAKVSLYPLIVTNIIIISNAITSLTPLILRRDLKN